MYTPREFSFITPEAMGGVGTYRRVCRQLGLHETKDGYGLLHVVDEAGDRHTVITTDVAYVRMIAEAPGSLGGVEIPPGKFPRVRAGWPDEWS